VLDGNGKHVKIGETGEIVLTSFGNFFQPFIRYRTGDLAEYGGQDRGFVILNRIFGRTQDYIVGKDNKRIMLVGLIHGGHFAAFKAIKCWQIRQDKPGKILLKIQPDRNWNDICEKEILNKLNFNGKVDVELRYCEDFELTKAGKRKFVIQTVK
jgi:phenylacetate-CoA ligase